MTADPCFVTGLGFWAPRFPSVQAWLDKTSDDQALKPQTALLPSRSKRGTSLVTRMAVEVVEQATAQAKVDPAEVAMIFGSALGEVQTAIDQMVMIESEDGRLSPTRFKNSVHNTAAGLLSIAVGNRNFSSAIAAGPLTTAMCLLEGMTLLDTQGGTIVIALSEESVPKPFDGAGRGYGPLAYGLCLTKDRTADALATVCGLGQGSSHTPRDIEGAEQLSDNPIACGLGLFEAILSQSWGIVPLESRPSGATCYTIQVEKP